MLQSRYILHLILLLLLPLHSIPCSAQGKQSTIDSLKQILKQSPNQNQAGIYALLADEYQIVSGDSALYYANRAKTLGIKYEDHKAQSDAYIVIGKVQRNQGLYQQALANTIKGLKITEEHGAEQDLISIYNSIGILYKRMRQFDEALPYYLKANRLAIKYDQDREASLTYNNIGTIYLEKEKWDTVMRYYDSAIYYADKAKDNRAMATVLTNIADTYMAHKKFDSALTTLKKCLTLDKANQDKYGMFMSYFQIARAYAAQQEYHLATIYADSAEIVAEKEQMNRERIDLFGWRSNVEEGRGNIEQALYYFRKSRLINDTLFTEKTAQQVAELQTKYETAKKEQKIAVQKSEIVKRNYIIGGISIAIIFLGLLGFSYYNRYKLIQQDKLQKAIIHQQELATKAVIDAEEKERKRIAGDLHDGVGQVMSAARMNLNAVRSEIPFQNEEQKAVFDKAIYLVDEGCKEVRNVSHNIMPHALLNTGLESAIREFIEKIDYRVLDVNFYSEGLKHRLPSNIETVLYRVIQECVNNVIKHAKATKLDITLIKDEDGISATIEDDGIGFDTTAESAQGVGLKNMQTRIDYLKGTIEWDSTIGKGTVVMIQIPVAEINRFS